MDLLCIAVVSSAILAAGGALMLWHVRAWRAACRARLDSREYDFRWRQYRRRMQTSAMLGLVGLGLGVGGWLMHVHCTPLTVTVYWIGLLILLGWVAVLAGIDFWATKHHYGRLRHECFLEQTKLQAELQRRRND